MYGFPELMVEMGAKSSVEVSMIFSFCWFILCFNSILFLTISSMVMSLESEFVCVTFISYLFESCRNKFVKNLTNGLVIKFLRKMITLAIIKTLINEMIQKLMVNPPTSGSRI